MRLASRADLARLKGVSNAAVTIACRGALSAACVGDRVDLDHPAVADYMAKGKGRPKVSGPTDPEAKRPAPSPATVSAPAQSPAVTPTDRTVPKKSSDQRAGAKQKGKPGRKRRTSSTATATDTGPGDSAPSDSAPQLDEHGFAPELEELTAREIAERYGTSRAYVDWLDAYQKQQRGRELWLKNQQTEGSLISRELVQHRVFGAIDSSHKRLLTDAAKTLAARLFALCRAGASAEEAEREARDIISKQLKPVKAAATRTIGNG